MQSNADKLRALGIPIPLNKTAGHHKVRCPRCASAAKHKNKTDLSVDLDNGQWRCHNTPECDYKGFVGGDITRREKVYVKPTPRYNITPLHNDLVQWFGNRCISQQTLIDRGVMDGPEYMHGNKLAQPGTYHTMQFPYLDKHGELVNIKYRSAFKQFKFVTNAKLIMSNLNNIVTQKWCIVVEGEIDELTYWEAGYKMHVTSVPNGASSSTNANLEYLDNCWEVFEQMDKIILSTDDDEPGRALRAELIRRLGPERCYTVTYGEGCKDINEHAMKFGILSVESVIGSVVACPIKGIRTAESMEQAVMDLFRVGLKPGDQIGIRDTGTHEELVSYLNGQLIIISGIPGHGKSEGTDQDMVMLAVKHGWKFGVFSPENYPLEMYISKLIEKVTGKHFGPTVSNIPRLTEQEISEAIAFINDHFFFITEEDVDSFSVFNILDHARILVKKYGIRGILIDPWNTLEHSMEYNENETMYINRALRKIILFNRMYNVCTFIIAHPEKMKTSGLKGAAKNYPDMPTLYNISGSANWANRADIGIIWYRDFENNINIRKVVKIKQKHQGKVGTVKYKYNRLNGRFTDINESHDTRNWLHSGCDAITKPALDFNSDQSIIEGNNDEPHPLD